MKLRTVGRLLFLLLHLCNKHVSCQEVHSKQNQNSSLKKEKLINVSSPTLPPQIQHGYPVVSPLPLHQETPSSVQNNRMVDSLDFEEFGSFVAGEATVGMEHSYGERLEPKPTKFPHIGSQPDNPIPSSAMPTFNSVPSQYNINSSSQQYSYPIDEFSNSLQPGLISEPFEQTSLLLPLYSPHDQLEQAKQPAPEDSVSSPYQLRQKLTYPITVSSYSKENQQQENNPIPEPLVSVPLPSAQESLIQVMQPISEQSVSSSRQPRPKLTYPGGKPSYAKEHQSQENNSTPELSAVVPLPSPQKPLVQATQPIPKYSASPPHQPRRKLTFPVREPEYPKEHQSQESNSSPELSTLVPLSSPQEPLVQATQPIREQSASPPHLPRRKLTYPVREPEYPKEHQSQESNSSPELSTLLPLSSPQEPLVQATQPIPKHSASPPHQPRRKLTYLVGEPEYPKEHQSQEHNSTPELSTLVPLSSPQESLVQATQPIPKHSASPPHQPRRKLTYPVGEPEYPKEHQPQEHNSTPELSTLVPLSSPQESLVQATQPIPKHSASSPHQPRRKLTYPVGEPEYPKEHQSQEHNSTPELSTLVPLSSPQESLVQATQPIREQSASPPHLPRRKLTYPVREPEYRKEHQSQENNSTPELSTLVPLSSPQESLVQATQPIREQSASPPHLPRRKLTYPVREPEYRKEHQSQENNLTPELSTLVPLSSPQESLVQATQPIREQSASPPHQPRRKLTYPVREPEYPKEHQSQEYNSTPELSALVPLSSPQESLVQATQPTPKRSASTPHQPRQELTYSIEEPLYSKDHLTQENSLAPEPLMLVPLSSPDEVLAQVIHLIPEHSDSTPHQSRQNLTYPVGDPSHSEQNQPPENNSTLESVVSVLLPSLHDSLAQVTQSIPETSVAPPHQPLQKLTYPIGELSYSQEHKPIQHNSTPQPLDLLSLSPPHERLKNATNLTSDHSPPVPRIESLNSTLELSSLQPLNTEAISTQIPIEFLITSQLLIVDVSQEKLTGNSKTLLETTVPPMVLEIRDRVRVKELAQPSAQFTAVTKSSYPSERSNRPNSRKRLQYPATEQSEHQQGTSRSQAQQSVTQSNTLQSTDVLPSNQNSTYLRFANLTDTLNSSFEPPSAAKPEEIQSYVIQKRIDIAPADSSSVVHPNTIYSDRPTSYSIGLSVPPPIPISRLNYPVERPLLSRQHQTQIQPLVTSQENSKRQEEKLETVEVKPQFPSVILSSKYAEAAQLETSTINQDERTDVEGYRRTLYVNYPISNEFPSSVFSCNEKQYPGYYADVATGCQVFHVCQQDGRHDSFLCPNGSLFHQQFFVCDWWYNVDCAASPNYYELNKGIGKINLKFMPSELDNSLVSKY